MNKELAELLFPHITKTPSYYEEMYQERNLDKKAIVTRFAPSPTGFVHMGSLYTAFLASQMAKQTGGVFYLRIEDTDQKREIENGITGIIDDLASFNFEIDEGPLQSGEYGPYIQSERKEIYQTYVKDLVEKGLAYPCFCTEEELTSLRQRQELLKERIGYYGPYAINRNLTLEEIKAKLNEGLPYVIRLKSPGKFSNTITFHDCIKGNISFPENDMDIVLLKQDGIPTYHFAHVVDDHLMHTTHVTRGDEWLSSVPIHLQLFQVLGFKSPKYAHIAPLTKREGENTVRKLSKRKDPEASIRFYNEKGIPADAVKLFLATLLNANFEMWYQQNKDKTIDDFKFEFNKMPVGGTYFDLEKLNSISKIYFSMLKASDLYEQALVYFKEYDQDFYELIKGQKDKTIALLNIEREIKRPRKDLACYKDIKSEFQNFYDEIFLEQEPAISYSELNAKDYNLALLERYQDIYSEEDTKEEWMNKLKDLSEEFGYASEVKAYKENPENYKGHVGDVCETVRACVTGRTMSPDLYEILKVLGKDSLRKRVVHFKKYLEK